MTLRVLLKRIFNPRAHKAGLSLIELVIAISILSVAIMGFVSSFTYITRSIHVSRARTLASNLCQEKIENMKDTSYHKLQLSTETASDNNFSPALVYDENNQAPETIVIGGMTFVRRTFVAFAEITDNVISTVTFNYPDTGLKQLRVHVVWQEKGDWKKMELQNIYENPDIDPLNTVIEGCVQTAADCGTGNGIASAQVQVVGTSWRDTADADGNWSIQVHAGTYTLRASSNIYLSDTQNFIGASTGTTTTVNFTLTQIQTGKIQGNPWVNTGPVIAAICLSTTTEKNAGLARTDIEWVELFNPTTFTVTVNGGLLLNFWDEDGVKGNNSAPGDDKAHAAFGFTFVNNDMVPGESYLIANSSTFLNSGVWSRADAHYNGNYFSHQEAGSLQLLWASNSSVLDTVGWTDNDSAAPLKEGNAIPDPSGGALCGDGPGIGVTMVRVSTPGTISDSYGPAYDTGDNATDFFHWESFCDSAAYLAARAAEPAEPYYYVAPARSTSDGTREIVSGKPAYGAVVTADDVIGPSATVTESSVTWSLLGISFTHPFPEFLLTGVATGTWTVLISTGSEYGQFENVAVTNGATTMVPNAATGPPWLAADLVATMLSTSGVGGFITGEVTDVNDSAIPNLALTVGGQDKTTGANGRYFSAVSTGLITLVANPNNISAEYVESIAQVTIEPGVIATQDFQLSQGGIIQGFATSDGSSILPGIEFTATKSGAQYGAGTTDASGHFYIKNLGTGTYTVKPALDSSEASDPVSLSSPVVVNDTLFIGTYTITGALGTLTGNITLNSVALTAGALILASTAAITTPPMLVGSSSPANTFLYAASSKADGTYTMEVRGNATYYISAFLPTIKGSVVTIATYTTSDVYVAPSATTIEAIDIVP